MQFVETLKKVDVNISASGDNEIIAAPGDGHYLAIDFLGILPTTAVTIQLKEGTTAYGGPFPLDAKQSMTFENAMNNEHGVITCDNNKSFVINLGSAVQVGGFIRYRIIGE